MRDRETGGQRKREVNESDFLRVYLGDSNRIERERGRDTNLLFLCGERLVPLCVLQLVLGHGVVDLGLVHLLLGLRYLYGIHIYIIFTPFLHSLNRLYFLKFHIAFNVSRYNQVNLSIFIGNRNDKQLEHNACMLAPTLLLIVFLKVR